ncbi:MAG: hypothetical protein JJV98_12090 [Desulfosarcina sp.]|nr:hypothetical protein [Desulfobacterales bacterium]
MFKKSLSLLFILMLLTPAVVWLSTGPSSDIRQEPGPVAFPRPDGQALFKNDYYRALDRYINEQFIFRDRVIFIKNWLDFKFFSKTERGDIHVGRQGWLFRRIDVENHIQDVCAEDGSISRLLLELHALENVIEASGRRFRFLVVPSKVSIYPEYIGWVPLPAEGRCSAYDLFREAHRTHPLKNWVALEAPILASKFGSHLLYDPTAAYWNGRGAAVAADVLQRNFFNVNTLSPVLATAGRSDDLERQLLGLSKPSPLGTLRHLTGLQAEGLGRSLVYADAGIERLLPYLLQMTQRLDLLSSETIPSGRIGEDLGAFDTILIQTTESGIQDLRIDLDRIFDQLSDEAVWATHAPVDLKFARPMAHTALNLSARGLEVKSLGSRSAFALVDLPGSYRGCFRVLRLNLTVLQPDVMTVTYPANPLLRVAKSLHPGRFNLYLPLPVKSRVSLRFHPGRQAGLLVLHKAEIIGFPKSGAAACGQSSGIDKAGIMMVDTSASPNANLARSTLPSRLSGALSSRSTSPGAGGVSGKTVEKTNPLPANAQEAKQVPAPARPATGTIALNDFSDGRIFQRQNRQADIIVSGVYTGSISGIQARVIRQGGIDQVVPWTVIDEAPRNGIFLGLLPRVPEGGWYALEVRAVDDHSLLSKGKNRWGIGILMACIGQSNMREWFHTGTDLEAHPFLRWYTGSGWHEPGRRGNGAIACGNRIIARTGVPVGLIEYAVNGSGLHRKADWGTGYWEDTRPKSIYRRFVSRVAATGGRLEFVLWIQGEADAARGNVTREDYQAALTRFITRQVRRDIANASAQPQLPFLVAAMVKRPGGLNVPHQAIREAQLAVTEQVVQCYLAATTLDLKNRGKQHLAPQAYTTMGNRVAQTVLYVLGLEDFYRGPRVATVRQSGELALDVTLRHSGGTDITPETGITGWEIIDAAGAAPIQKVFRQAPRTIRILLGRALQGQAEVRYLYGARPDARRALRDNASPRLPLEAFRGGVSPPSAPPDKTAPEAVTQ